ncbi:efflux RND transporter periplasmic adaptor subunit [Chelatococcus caeni]|nr:efflux RND transporter periplasmic adaptor subunit [Chelatococcus caeni]
MRAMRPLFLSLIVAGLAACSDTGEQQAGQGAPPPSPVTVAKPLVKEVVERDDFTGRFAAVDAVEVRSRVSGYLERVDFEDGANVKAGDVLFVIDRRQYKAALDQAQATLVSAQARLNFAESDLDRAESLRRTGNISDQLLDQRRQNFLTAKAELDRAQAAMQEASLNYEFSEVKAPISGRISRRFISTGNLVNANDTLLTTIVSLDPIYFYFDVDERSFLAYNRVFNLDAPNGSGEPVAVQIALTDETKPAREGKLDFVDNRLDEASGTMRLRAIVPNAELFITPGLFGRVSVPGSPPYQGVLVPDEAIATDQERRLVWVVGEDNTVKAQLVRPGPRIDGYRLFREGLKGDETIVVNGLQRVRPGAAVAPEMTTLPPTR